MFAYNLRLAWLSIRRTPIVSALTVAAIATGIGACMTMLSIYYLSAQNPIAHKSDVLFHVQVDNRPVREDYDPAEEPRDQLSYIEAEAFRATAPADAKAAMYKTAFAVQPENPDVLPYQELGRATDNDFFDMFDLEFLEGSAWPDSVDQNPEPVAVITQSQKEKLYGADASAVGKRLRLDQTDYEIVGVVKDFEPVPKFYDLTNGDFNDAEPIFVPYSLTVPEELSTAGNTNCNNDVINSFEEFLASTCVWITMWVQLNDAESEAQFRDYLQAYTQQKYDAGVFEREPNWRLRDVQEWLVEQDVAGDDVRVLMWLSFLFLSVCLLNTVGLILAKFLARAPQIALRRAVVASRMDLFAQNLIEVAMIGAIGGVFGVLLARAGLWGLATMVQSIEKVAYLNLTLVGLAVLLAIGSALAAGIYPAYRVGRIPPASLLKTQ